MEALRAFYEHRGLEPRTHKNYTTIRRNYEACCAKYSRVAWPATYDTVSLYFLERCHVKRCTVRTLKDVITSLEDYATQQGLPWLSQRDRLKLKRLKRGLAKYDRKPIKRKLPITYFRIAEMLTKTSLQPLQQLQYAVISMLCHDSLLRYSELHKLRMRDVSFIRKDAVKIHLEVTKPTYEEGPQDFVVHAYDADGSGACGVTLLRIYLDRMTKDHTEALAGERPLFPNIRLGTAYKSPTPKKHFIAWVRDLLGKAGYEPSKFSGHSFRAGGATDLFAGGADPRTIKLAGRWKSEAYLLYLRDHPEDSARTISGYFKAAVALRRDIGRTDRARQP
jgi:integrase